MAVNVTVEDNFEDVADKFRAAGTKALRAVDEEMAVTGEKIRQTAEEIAHRHNPSIKVDVHPLPGAVEIIGSSGDSPIAALEELGNKGKGKSVPTWSHPVFDNRTVWVNQMKHRYLQPALTAQRPFIRRNMEGKLAESLREAGFEVET